MKSTQKLFKIPDFETELDEEILKLSLKTDYESYVPEEMLVKWKPIEMKPK